MVVREISDGVGGCVTLIRRRRLSHGHGATQYPAICGWHTTKFVKENNGRCFQVDLARHFGGSRGLAGSVYRYQWAIYLVPERRASHLVAWDARMESPFRSIKHTRAEGPQA